MKIILNFFGFLLFSNLLSAQTLRLHGWSIDTFPTTYASLKPFIYSDIWFFSKNRDTIYPQKVSKNNLTSIDYLKNYRLNTHKTSSIKVSKGEIFIQNRYEHGSLLLFKSSDGKKSYQISPLSGICWLLKHNNNLLCVESTGYLGTKYGKLLSLEYIKKWEVKALYNFTETLLLLYPHDDLLFAVCNNTIGYFSSTYSFTSIVKLPISIDVLGPTSMQIQDKDIFIAMAGGILKVSDFLKNPQIHWLTLK